MWYDTNVLRAAWSSETLVSLHSVNPDHLQQLLSSDQWVQERINILSLVKTI